jgi:glycosyltransferase involved in cell wall biosynthesis
LLARRRFTLTAPSDRAAETAIRTLGRQVDFIIPFGLDTRGLPEPSPRRDIDILAVGSLIDVKRMEEVIGVAHRLAPSFPDLNTVIVGDGPLRVSIVDRIREARLRDRVRLAGRLPREDVLSLMSRSRILLHPSEYESQGYVFLEALASGMRVVCRDVGAPGSSSKVTLCSTTDEMVAATAAILVDGTDYTPVAVPDLNGTVAAYEEVYSACQSSFGPTSHRS